MNKLNNSFVETVDRLTRKSATLSTLLDRVVAHVVPQQAASACYGTYCGSLCGFDGNGHICGSPNEYTAYYYNSAGSCYPLGNDQGPNGCIVFECGGCQ